MVKLVGVCDGYWICDMKPRVWQRHFQFKYLNTKQKADSIHWCSMDSEHCHPPWFITGVYILLTLLATTTGENNSKRSATEVTTYLLINSRYVLQ